MKITIESEGGAASVTPVTATQDQSLGALGAAAQVSAGAAPGAGPTAGGAVSATPSSGSAVNVGPAPAPPQSPTAKS
jgi:hypothetical protein